MSHVEVVDNGPKEFSEEELEHMLSQCRLHKEKQKMETTSTPDSAVAHVNAASQVGRTIGPLLYKDVTIEGMPVAGASCLLSLGRTGQFLAKCQGW